MKMTRRDFLKLSSAAAAGLGCNPKTDSGIAEFHGFAI